MEKRARDIIERCKLPEAIKLRTKLGYNHNDIMIREETSTAGKIINFFPKILYLITENQIFGFGLMKEIIKIMTQMMKKTKTVCLKSMI